MKKFFIFIIFLFCICSFSSGKDINLLKEQEIKQKQRSIQLTGEEQEWLNDHPVIRVAYDPSWPPIEFSDSDGELSGVSNDYLKLIELKIGIQFERVNCHTWQEAYSKLKKWEIDMTTCVNRTPDREQFWAFTKPYNTFPIVILTHTDVTYISDIKELAGKKVAVIEGYSSSEQLIKDYPGLDYVPVKNIYEGIQKLENGEVFALVNNMLVVSYNLAKYRILDLKITGKTPYLNAQCMAVRKDWAILAGIIQKALDTISENEATQIFQKWVPVRYEYGFNYKYVWYILLISVLIFTGLILWNQSLSKEIKSRKNAETLLIISEEKYRKIFENVQDVVFQTDDKSVIINISPSVFRVYGFNTDDLLNKHLANLFENQPTERNIFKELEDNSEIWNLEVKVRTKSGEPKYSTLNCHKLTDATGKFLGLEGSIHDISERKKAEIELIEAKDRAEESNRLKTAFLNNISHEVRTPLSGIIGFAELALNPEISIEEKKNFLGILNSSTDRLLDTITNYMDASLIVSGKINVNYKSINPFSIINEIYYKFNPKCKSKNLSLILQMPTETEIRFVQCDPTLLEKSVSHLMDNAVKFTSKGSITLGLTSSNDEFVFFVKDTGNGIDLKSQRKIFEYFRQEEDAITRGYEGSGLGLTIAKGFVELMGGKLRMESVKDEGSVFYLSFPFEKGLTRHPGIDTSDKSKSKQNPPELILIVEDNDISISYMKMLLGKNGYNYLHADNGADAVELCQNQPDISLVLMDIKMPVMDGLEATRQIKSFRKSLPVIGVTAYAMIGDREIAMRAGCDDYLTKPINQELLLSVIQKHLNTQTRT
jgi:PAS domain S-box-containing protein